MNEHHSNSHVDAYKHRNTFDDSKKALNQQTQSKQTSNQPLLERYLVGTSTMLHSRNTCAKKPVSSEMHYLLKALSCTQNVQDNVRPTFRSLLVQSRVFCTLHRFYGGILKSIQCERKIVSSQTH